MAIDDNTSYELTGAQVKDLASKIKSNTALAKNLSGGSDKTTKLVYMTAINSYDASRIANEIDPQQASSTMVTSLMKYRFFDAETGEEYSDIYDVMDILDQEYGLIEYVQTPSGNSDYPIVKMVESAVVRADGDDYYIDIVLKTFDKASLTVRQEEVTIGEDTQYNLYWYKTTSTISKLTRARGYIQAINSYSSAIATEINDSLPSGTPSSEYADALQINSFMSFAFFGESGEMLKTVSSIRNLLRANVNAVGPLVYVATPSFNDNASYIVEYSWSGSASTGYGELYIYDPSFHEEVPYTIRAVDPTQYDDGRKHYWYKCTCENTGSIVRFPYGYSSPNFYNPGTSVPENLYQVATDSSNNLYMASAMNNTSDWKQINNDAVISSLATVATSGSYADLSNKPTIPTVNDGTLTIQHNGTTKGTFTANQSSASTVNIETATKTGDLTNNGDGTAGSAYVATTDTGTVSTNMIANGAITAGKIDGTSVRKMEVLYNYVQASDSSATTNYDVPVDFNTYKYLELSVDYSTSGSSGTAWSPIRPLTSSKGSVQCRQCGIEAQNTTTLSGINRNNDEIIAARYQSGNPTGYEVRFHVGAGANSCIAFARGFGGDNGWQILNVKVGTDVGIGAVKYLRVPLVTPRAGAHITLWGVKGTDMGY